MLYLVCLGLFLPLAGFLGLVMSSGKIGRWQAGFFACANILISFLCFFSLLIYHVMTDMKPESFTLFQFVPIDKINSHFILHLDSLSILMTLIITGVGFLIHVYSNGYMNDEKDYARYFGFMNFFIFSMLLLVLAGDLLVLFVGWEGVGLASYLLIGFWYNRPAAARAATKAFVINRIGDAGLLVGLLLTFHLFGTGNIAEISQRVGKEFASGAPILTILTLLYFIGATGKSAQLPLYTWLPDAMEGPTPVSALIHAATMVTAGVYLVVRMHEVFILAPITLLVIGVVGAVTSLFAALCASGQTDLKRALAFSTVSQLGLMFLACGATAFYSGMFHLTTHAFVKALLFLSAGNVVHMLHGTTEMGQMGGLAKKLTKTHWLFLIGVLALSGIPPMATYFSKDLILEQEYLSGFKILFYIGLAASILTGFYMTRAYFLTFKGPTHLAKDHFNSIKEAPSVMLIPVALLAFLAIFGGFLGFPFAKIPMLEGFLAEVGVTDVEKELRSGFSITPETWIAVGGAIFGVGSAALIYALYAERLGPTLTFLRRAFFVNEIYWVTVALPLKGVAWLIANVMEPKVFDQSIKGIVEATQSSTGWLQKLQSGQIRSYVAWFVVGSVLLIAYLVF